MSHHFITVGQEVWVQTLKLDAMKTGIIAILLICCLPISILFAQETELREIQDEIANVRLQVQKNTASFLLVSKQITQSEQSVQSTYEFVQITDQRVIVQELDLETSPTIAEVLEGDELKLNEEKNDWLNIELEDGRDGWVRRENVQIIERRERSERSVSVDPHIRQMTEQLYSNIQSQFVRAKRLFDEFDEIYDDLTTSEKTEFSGIYSDYQSEKEKIQTYRAYANHYHEKTESVPSALIVSTDNGQRVIGFQGTASLRLGTSSYQAATKQSASSRNVNVNGAVIFSPQSRLNVNINHNNDVVQTPYTSNNVNLSYQHQTEGGTRLRGSVLYNSYNDENLDRNNFKNVGIGANVEHPLSNKTRVFGDINANSKSFDVEDGNGFEGAAFNSGLNYNGAKTQANVGVRGRVQNSDVSFLDFMRVIPNASVRWLTKSGSFGIRAEAEQLAYDTEAEGNNFNRGRVDLQWAGRMNSTSLIVIAKQYPNNEAFDNYRLRLQNQWNKTKDYGSARSALSVQYVYHTQEDTQLANYIDLRLDRNTSGQRAYFDLNLFGRYWEDTDRYHRVDFFSRFGFKFNQFQIGPAIGAQLLLNQNDLQIEQNGNSFRLGVDARVNTAIETATVYGSLRYQKSLVYNSEISINTSTGTVTQGELQSRIPTTIQFSAGVQVPIIGALDFKIDASYYNVDLDISDEISINQVQTRTGLRVLGGISYRFQK